MKKILATTGFLLAAIIAAGCSSATSPGSTSSASTASGGSDGGNGGDGACPARWTEDVCGQTCAPVGTSCWYGYDQNPISQNAGAAIGDAYFCKTWEDDAGVSKDIWVCGV